MGRAALCFRLKALLELGIRNEELGMKVAASPQIYMGRYANTVFPYRHSERSRGISTALR